jgi:hypothetical protein
MASKTLRIDGGDVIAAMIFICPSYAGQQVTSGSVDHKVLEEDRRRVRFRLSADEGIVVSDLD